MSSVASGAVVLVVRADSPYKTLADVVAAAKAKPGSLTVATPGTGTIAHLVTQLWQNASGVNSSMCPTAVCPRPCPTSLVARSTFTWVRSPRS